MSSLTIDVPTDLMTLSPTWYEAGDEPRMRVGEDYLAFNKALCTWFGNKQVTFQTERGDTPRSLYLRRVDPYSPLPSQRPGSSIKHWELQFMLYKRGYEAGHELVFAETGDPDVLVATLRGGKR